MGYLGREKFSGKTNFVVLLRMVDMDNARGKKSEPASESKFHLGYENYTYFCNSNV